MKRERQPEAQLDNQAMSRANPEAVPRQDLTRGSSRPAELAALDRITTGGRRLAKKKFGQSNPAEWSSARDPQLLGDLVDELAEQQGWDTDISLADLVVRWGAMVGQVNALHCRPVSYDNGLLVIQAESSAWATAINLSLGAIQQRIDGEIGPGLVTEVKVRGPAGPPRAKGQWRVKSPK